MVKKYFKLFELWKRKKVKQKLLEDLKIKKEETENLKKKNDRIRMERNQARLELSGSKGTN